jgi:uncharacterized protein involved in outer membrane biogenesis
MKKILSLFIGALGLALVLAIALVIYVSTLDPNDYKELIARQVRDETGRELSLNGDIQVSYYPWLGLEINDMTLANAEGFGEEPMLRVDYAQVRVKTLPLLRQQYEIDTVRLHGAVINLVKRNDGVTNWQDLAKVDDEPQPLPLSALVLGGVDIKDARLNWRDEVTGAVYTIQDLDMTTGELVYGQPIQLRMTLAAAANQPAIEGDAALTGVIAYDVDDKSVRIQPLDVDARLSGPRIPRGNETLKFSAAMTVDFAGGTASLSDMQLAALGLQAGGEVKALNLQTPAPTLETALDVAGTDLALLFKVAEIEPLATQLAGLRERRFTLKTRVHADTDRGDIDVPEFAAELLGASIRGQIKAQNIRSDKASFQGELNATGPDLPSMMQVAGQIAGGESSPLSKYGAQLTAIPARQKNFAVDAYLDADLGSGDVNVPRLSAQALGMTATGNLKAQAMQDRNGSIAGQLRVTGQDLSSVLAALDQPSLAGSLQEFQMETAISGNRGDLNLKPLALTARFAGPQIPNGPVALTLNADTRVNLDADELHLDDFSVQGLGLNVHGQLDAGEIRQAPRYHGRLQVAEFDLRRLLQQLQIEPPDTADPAVLRKVALSTQFTGSAAALDVSDLLFVLDETTLNGYVKINDLEKTALDFGLAVDALNADRYLPPEQEGRSQRRVKEEATKLPVDTLRALNAKGQLRIGQLTIAKATMSNVNLALNGKDGVVKLEPVSAVLYQGSHAGDVTLNAADPKKPVRLTINTALKNIEVDQLVTDLTGKRKVRGRADISAALFAVGDDTDMIKQTLNGQMSFSIRDGALVGFNLGKILRMGNQLQENMTLKVSEQEETDFAEITGNPVVTNGVVTLDDLSGKSPALRLNGKGILADFPENTLDYTITAHIVATSKGQGGRDITEGKLEGVPLDCRFSGSLDNPKRNCDATKLIAALGLKAIKGVISLPGKVIQGGSEAVGGNPLGNFLNRISSPRQGDETQDEQQTPESTEPAPEQKTEDPVKQAKDLLKGIIGR